MLISWRSADRGCQTWEGWEKLGIELNVSISRKRRDVFLKRCKRYGYCQMTFPIYLNYSRTLTINCYSRISHNVTHVLKPLLPTNTHHSFSLRDRRHNFVLIEINSQINHWHFIIRQLYKYS